MSIHVMSDTWADEEITESSMLLVLLKLGDYADDDGHCFPSVGRVAKECRLSVRGTQQIMARARRMGKLKVKLGGGRRKTNRYTVTVNRGARETPNPNAGNPVAGADRTIIEPSDLKRERTHARKEQDEAEFEEIWDLYAYKVKKEPARRAWKRLTASERLQARAAMPTYVACTHPEGDGGMRLRAHLATWLHDKRWNDEHRPTKHQQSNGQHTSARPRSNGRGVRGRPTRSDLDRMSDLEALESLGYDPAEDDVLRLPEGPNGYGG